MSEKVNGSFFSGIIKGIFLSLTVALVGILIFAGVVKVAKLNESVIKAGNQFIKILAIFLGALGGIRVNRGAIKGGLIGLGFSLLIQLIFGIMGSGQFGAHFALDMLFSFVVGAIAGIIILTIKAKRS